MKVLEKNQNSFKKENNNNNKNKKKDKTQTEGTFQYQLLWNAHKPLFAG